MSEPKVLLSGLGIPDSPRWHDGRLWFCNWIEQQVVAGDLDGRGGVHPRAGRAADGWSIELLPDGRLLTTGDKLRRQEPEGSVVVPRRADRERDRVACPRQHLPEFDCVVPSLRHPLQERAQAERLHR